MPYAKQRAVKRELAQYAKDRDNPAQGLFRLAYNTFRMKGAPAAVAEALATESVRKAYPGFAPARLTRSGHWG